MKPIKYKGYTIHVSVAVCNCDTMEIVEEFDTYNEAKAYIRNEELWDLVEIWYLAEEEIDAEGNVNPACWGKTRQEALSKLKAVLN